MAFPALDIELFKCLVPEFANKDPVVLNKIASVVSECFNECVWGSKIDMGLVYAVAHTLKMSTRAGAGGVIQSEKVGDLSRTYAVEADESLWGQTSYGKEYLRLVSILPKARPIIVSC